MNTTSLPCFRLEVGLIFVNVRSVHSGETGYETWLGIVWLVEVQAAQQVLRELGQECQLRHPVHHHQSHLNHIPVESSLMVQFF